MLNGKKTSLAELVEGVRVYLQRALASPPPPGANRLTITCAPDDELIPLFEAVEGSLTIELRAVIPGYAEEMRHLSAVTRGETPVRPEDRDLSGMEWSPGQ